MPCQCACANNISLAYFILHPGILTNSMDALWSPHPSGARFFITFERIITEQHFRCCLHDPNRFYSEIGQNSIIFTTLKSMMNANFSPHRFWPCHENRLIKTIHTIPHNLYVSFKLASLYSGLRLILVYPNPQ